MLDPCSELGLSLDTDEETVKKQYRHNGNQYHSAFQPNDPTCEDHLE